MKNTSPASLVCCEKKGRLKKEKATSAFFSSFIARSKHRLLHALTLDTVEQTSHARKREKATTHSSAHLLLIANTTASVMIYCCANETFREKGILNREELNEERGTLE